MTFKSIILLDFDNVFSSLWSLDRAAADLFASSPGDWLQILANSHLTGDSRRWLVTRCYFNPNGYVPAPGEPRDRRYFSQYREALVRAGFEVIDCPPVSRGVKNAADIRLVIDALELVDHQTRFDEFVIASGDSDFTPLLQRLKMHDRRTVILSPGFLASAYGALADRIVGYESLVELLRPEEYPVVAADDEARPMPEGDEQERSRSRFEEIVRRRYEEAGGPVPMAALVKEVDRTVPEARQSGWFGRRSFSRALASLDLPNVRFSQHHFWDDDRHQPPPSAVVDEGQALPSVIELLVEALDLPRLVEEDWPKLFQALADYAATHEFNLAEATRWTRDTLADRGVRVARNAISYVVHGVQIGGAWLDVPEKPDASAIAEAFHRSLMQRAADQGMVLDEGAQVTVRSWLGLQAQASA